MRYPRSVSDTLLVQADTPDIPPELPAVVAYAWGMGGRVFDLPRGYQDLAIAKLHKSRKASISLAVRMNRSGQ